jgi:hypothetical protein
MEKMLAYVVIFINRSTNRVITQVRTSILSAHLHEKRIADTLENIYFLYDLCRIRIRIRIRKKKFGSESEKYFFRSATLFFMPCDFRTGKLHSMYFQVQERLL